MPGKRAVIALFLILLAGLTLCQCGRPAQSEPNVLSQEDAGDEALAPAALTDRLKGLSGDQIVWVDLSRDQLSGYYGFAGDQLLDFSVLVSDSDALANEIAVFLPKDADARLRVLEGVNQHLTKTAAGFRDLSETEYKKLQNRLIMELDGMIVLTVMDNTSLYYNALRDLGAQEINE